MLKRYQNLNASNKPVENSVNSLFASSTKIISLQVVPAMTVR